MSPLNIADSALLDARLKALADAGAAAAAAASGAPDTVPLTPKDLAETEAAAPGLGDAKGQLPSSQRQSAYDSLRWASDAEEHSDFEPVRRAPAASAQLLCVRSMRLPLPPPRPACRCDDIPCPRLAGRCSDVRQLQRLPQEESLLRARQPQPPRWQHPAHVPIVHVASSSWRSPSGAALQAPLVAYGNLFPRADRCLLPLR